ncbi:SAM-dependent methyltransferase [Dactylosporangium darangshiense]|uniref:SAM-dependent methyltransferase n=1 Tax=Dactylosporangium darangshiense TaxID=579108 RepID=A0ABP8D8E6_9ACTN
MSGAEWMRKPAADREPIDLQTDRPHPARVYDYLLGGKDNFPTDRAAAEQGLQANPNSRIPPRENRNFLRRVVEYLAVEQGVRQFLDIGTGIPTSPNVHEVAQAVAPDSRIVYVDNDPIVLAHARALLTSKPEGRTEYVDADLRDVEQILSAPQLRAAIDLDRPVALMLIAIMHFVGDADRPYDVVRRLVDALPSGSYLALSHLTGDFDQAAWDRVAAIYARQGVTMQVRSHDEIARFFDGLELLDPGLPIVTKWRPDADVDPNATDTQVAVYGGVARKP